MVRCRAPARPNDVDRSGERPREPPPPARRRVGVRAPAVLPSLALVIVLAACSAGGAATPSGGGTSGSGGAGSGGDGSSGSGIPAPGTSDPQGTLIFPKPGVQDPRPVPVQAMRRQPAAGDHLVIRVDWTSGIEPCTVFSGVAVAERGSTFTLTVMEGSQGQAVACPDIAQLKATLVDLGALPAGTYTIAAVPGYAPPLTIALP